MKLLVFLVCCLPTYLLAQLFFKTTDTAVLVKWYTPPLVQFQGCEVQWNTNSIKVMPFQNAVPPSLQAVANLYRDKGAMAGITGLTLLLNTFVSTDLAKYAGICTLLPKRAATSLTVVCATTTLSNGTWVDTIAPPTLSCFKQHKEKYMLKWNSIKGVYGYLLYDSTNTGWVCLNKSAYLDTTFMIRRATATRLFVRGLTVFGDTSLPSNIVELLPPPVTPPITGLQGMMSSNLPLLTWRKSGYTQFQVFRSAVGDSNKVLLALQTDTVFRDHPKDYGTLCYSIAGWVNDSVAGPLSAVVIDYADHDAPPTPTDLSYSETAEGLVLKWTAVKANDLAGYFVYRVINDSLPYYIKQSAVAVRQPSVLVQPSMSSHWCVAAVDWVGNRSAYSTIIACSRTLVLQAVKPFLFYAQPNDNQFVLKWLPVSNAQSIRIWLLRVDSARTEAVCIRTIPGYFTEWRLLLNELNGLYRIWIDVILPIGSYSLPSNTVSHRFKANKKGVN